MTSGAGGQRFESSFRQILVNDISFIRGNEPNGEEQIQEEEQQQLK